MNEELLKKIIAIQAYQTSLLALIASSSVSALDEPQRTEGLNVIVAMEKPLSELLEGVG